MHLIHGTLVVRPEGAMTAAAARELQDEVDKELAPGPRDVVLDLSGAERIDAGALAYLFRIQKRTRDGAARFCIAEASAAVLGLFECTHVARHLDLVASVDEALRTTVG
jgi:anti-anti-sigma factor